jgi:hypothetical protein
MECAALKVTGAGTLMPPNSALVKFPGAYSKAKGKFYLPKIIGGSYNNDGLVDPQLFRTSAGAIKDTAVWAVPGPAVWTGGADATEDEAPKAVPKIGKGKGLFFDDSEYVDLSVPEQEDW